MKLILYICNPDEITPQSYVGAKIVQVERNTK